MTLHNELTASWSLNFDRDGTEDIAVIYDGNGNDLLTSRAFWLPQGDDPVPPTLALVRLATAAPRLLESLRSLAEQADEDCPPEHRTRHFTDAIEQAHTVIRTVTAECPRCESDGPDIDALLAARRQVAVVWNIEDVQEIRPELNSEQAWDVLQAASRYHDATIGINWDVLRCHADMLFGDAPQTDKAAEA
jgi:hypothetical protein